MKLLKDIDNFYKKVLPLIISYVVGWFIGGLISLGLFFALLFGWRPFKDYDSYHHSNYAPSNSGMEVYQDGKRISP